MRDISFIPHKFEGKADSKYSFSRLSKKNEISLLFFLLSLILFLAASFFEKNIELNKIKTESLLSNLKGGYNLKKEEEILKNDKKLEALKVILKTHIFASDFLVFLEKDLAPYFDLKEAKVDFSPILGTTDSKGRPHGNFSIEGSALTYEILNAFSENLKGKKFLVEKKFSNVQKTGTSINLSIEGKFSEEIFSQK